MKKLFAALTALMLMTGIFGAAYASEGDRTVIFRQEDTEEYYNLEACLEVNGKVAYVKSFGDETTVNMYDPDSGETEVYDISKPMRELYGWAEDSEIDVKNWLDGYRDGGADRRRPEEDDEEDEDDENDSDEKNEENNEYSNVNAWFVRNGEICLIVSKRIDTGRETKLEGGYIYRLVLKDGTGELIPDESLRLDWRDMVESYEGWVDTYYFDNFLCAGDKLYMRVSRMDEPTIIRSFSLTDGKSEEIPVQDPDNFIVAEDGRILVTKVNWEGEQPEASLLVYDPANGSTEEKVHFPITGSSPTLLHYNAASDTLYYYRNGEIVAVKGFDISTETAVNGSPIYAEGGKSILLDGDRLLIWNYQGAVIRSIDPAKRAQTTLRIRNYLYSNAVDEALFRFSDSHGDISAVQSNDGDPKDVLQAMMSRDGHDDIYVMNMTSGQYRALYNRGYMADLSGSAKLAAFADSMYPQYAEAVKKDGKLLAVPIDIDSYGLGYNTETLKRLGMTEEDLPKTWDQFLDFVAELPEKAAGKSVYPFEQWESSYSVRSTMLENMLTGYEEYQAMKGEDCVFNSPVLRGLLDKLDALDLSACGLRDEDESYDEEMGMNYSAWDYGEEEERYGLFVFYVPLHITGNGGEKPLVLGFDEDHRIGFVNLSVAFVNPFSEHPQEAAAFLEQVTECLDRSALYSLQQDRNEPIRSASFEEDKARQQKIVEQIKAEMAKPEAEDDLDAWEKMLKDEERYLADMENYYWIISPGSIESYKALSGSIRPGRYNFYSELNNEDSDSVWESRDAYVEKNISAEELLSGIDKKVQMMRLEGN